MAASGRAFFLQEPDPTRAASGMWPEEPPAILWGQGDPAAIEPFTRVNKGSLYLNVNKTDDLPSVWVKVDEGLDAADWVLLDHKHITMSDLFDISAAASEQVILYADRALLITSAFLLWNEATAASGAAEGDITIGTTTGGAEIVAADAYDVSKATGSIQSLTIVDGALAAGGAVFASHDQASGAAGTCYLVLIWHYTA